MSFLIFFAPRRRVLDRSGGCSLKMAFLSDIFLLDRSLLSEFSVFFFFIVVADRFLLPQGSLLPFISALLSCGCFASGFPFGSE